MRTISLVIATIGLLVSCKPTTRVQPSAEAARPEATQGARQPIEGCSLITKEEVGAIQKATIYHATSSTNDDGSYVTSLCYYSSREPNQSVSLSLTQPGKQSNPRAYWQQVFGRFKEGEEEAREEREREEHVEAGKRREEEEEVPAPHKINGLGEEAFWSGNRFGGALYILKRDFVLRISVGGGESEEIKMEKSRALAEKALSRF